MHPHEKSIYLSALAAVIVLTILIFIFLYYIRSYQQKRNEIYRKKIREDVDLLEKERARISADFHDDLGAMLSAAKLGLARVQVPDTEMMAIIRQSGNYIDTVMEKVRQISNNLLPQALSDGDLKTAMEELVEMIRRTSRLKVYFSCRMDAIPVCKDQEVHIFRITQEILNNCLKHSDASRVDITLTGRSANIHLEIKDNGRGFDEQKVRIQKRGLGIHNIMSRVNLLNGTIYLDSAPGNGTVYTVEIPIKNKL